MGLHSHFPEALLGTHTGVVTPAAAAALVSIFEVGRPLETKIGAGVFGEAHFLGGVLAGIAKLRDYWESYFRENPSHLKQMANHFDFFDPDDPDYSRLYD
jgi:hypothetical protein